MTAASHFRSLQEQLDTSTRGGKLVFHVFAVLAEFERDLIREGTQIGLTAARARGKDGQGVEAPEHPAEGADGQISP